MRASRRRTATRVATVMAMMAVLVGTVGTKPASASAYPACDWTSTDPGAFPDAGEAADCLKIYGIALGKADGSFGEHDQLLRSQVSSLLVRLLQVAGITLTQTKTFPDVDANTGPNDQVRHEIELLAGAGIIAGFPDGDFRPGQSLTVAQAATQIIRMMQAIHAAKPNAPDLKDTGSTTANLAYATGNGLFSSSATDVNGGTYASTGSDVIARGLEADMLARSLQALINTGVVVAKAPPGGFPTLSANATWLEAVNWYRVGSGLDPAVEEPTWSQGIASHLHYLAATPPGLLTGQYANVHFENPASPFFTPEGENAGRTSNLAFGSTSERDAIDIWMSGPMHGIAVLRQGTTRMAFARDAGTATAGLDVLRGQTAAAVPRTVVFPGPNKAVSLKTYGNEVPKILETCGYASAGLPLFALLTAAPVPGLSAQLTLPTGVTNIAPNDLCIVDEHTYTSSDAVYGAIGKAILQADNAVVLVPRNPLQNGHYTANIQQPGRPDIVWSFDIA